MKGDGVRYGLLIYEANIISPDIDEIKTGLALFLDYAGKKIAETISFADYLLSAIANNRGLILLTLDVALQNFAHNKGIRVNTR